MAPGLAAISCGKILIANGTTEVRLSRLVNGSSCRHFLLIPEIPADREQRSQVTDLGRNEPHPAGFRSVASASGSACAKQTCRTLSAHGNVEGS